MSCWHGFECSKAFLRYALLWRNFFFRGTSPRTGSRIPTFRTSSAAGNKSFSTHNEEDNIDAAVDVDDHREQLRQLITASASTLSVALDADAAVRNNLAQLQSLILELQRACWVRSFQTSWSAFPRSSQSEPKNFLPPPSESLLESLFRQKRPLLLPALLWEHSTINRSKKNCAERTLWRHQPQKYS